MKKTPQAWLDEWNEVARTTHRPNVVMAERYGLSIRAVRMRVYNARKRGELPSHGQGRARAPKSCLCETSGPKQLTIESDGTARGTRVLVDGQELEGVTAIEWEIYAESGLASVRISLDGVPATVRMRAVEIESED